MTQRVSEVVIKNPFDLNQAISDLKFYYNLLVAHKDNGEIIFELWAKEDVYANPSTSPAELRKKQAA